MSTLRSDDDDHRGEEMTANPARYFGEAWDRSKRDVLAERRGEHKPATLVPGIVEMSLRGDRSDVERLVAAMREMGIVVWRRDSPGTKDGNKAGFSYFSVEVPPEAPGG